MFFNFSKSKRNTPETTPTIQATARASATIAVEEARDVIARVPKGGVLRAFLVATGKHLKKDDVPSLPGVDPDVDLIYERLVDPRCGFQPENVVVLKTDDYPTREEIENQVKKFLSVCKENDFIFLYFSGHGFHDVKTRSDGTAIHTDYYVPFDAIPIVERGQTVSFKGDSCFSLTALKDQIGNCKAKFKWVVVDACRVNHSARVGGDGDVWNRIGKLEAAKGSLWFQSCGINEKSYEICVDDGASRVNHGLFTWYFCEGARGEAANDDGLISPIGLFNYAKRKMREEHDKNRGYVPLQTPLYACQEMNDGEFVFVDVSENEAVRARKAYKEACDFMLNLAYEQALTKISEALALYPENDGYKELKASIESLLAEKKSKAIQKQAQEHITQGWNCLYSGKFSDALGKANAALQLEPGNVNALALKKQAENPNQVDAGNWEEITPSSSTSADVNVDNVRIENGKVYYAAAGKHAKAGHDAFAKTDYFLAKEEAEIALKFNPSNIGAQALLKKTQAELDKLAALIEEGNALFESGKYEEAMKKAREAKSLCVNYPDADALASKVKAPLVKALVIAGWEAYSLPDMDKATAKALEAFELNPNDEDVKELSEELGAFFRQTKPGARATLEINGIEFAFRYCPAGSFMMGSPAGETRRFDNEPQHSVTINEGCWICEVPTTQEQWNALGVKKAENCRFTGAKLPVENVTWYETDAFVKKLNESGVAPQDWRFELPTEEQWEYACRAGTTGATYGKTLDESAWYTDNSDGKTHEVGTKAPNNWGIFDMLGNVWEWTSTKSGSSFVYRGGSWLSVARGCRPANRGDNDPSSWRNFLGFRLSLVRSQLK